jgi:Pyruvate/2-oxoacid:ferredoxin oxidoreductase delta subunit
MSFRPAWWIRFLSMIWPLTRLAGRVYDAPLVGRLLAFLTLPLFSPHKQSLTYIPINHEISGGRSTPLPRAITAGLIAESSHRAIIHHCTCRMDRGCADHDAGLGCMLLGDGAAEIDAKIARHVTKEEALAHLDRALANGLMPLVGRAPIDNYMWGVANRGRLLTVCFCCRCCCTILGAGRYLPAEIHESIMPLPGVTVTTNAAACFGCEECVRECFMGALALVDGIAVRDESRCKCCGRCASVCIAKAIEVTVDDKTARADVIARIGRYVDFR